MVMNKLIEPGLKSVPSRGDIFVFYCSHCLQQSSAFISGGRGPSLSTSLTSHSHGLRSGKKTILWPYYANVLDPNMPFSERK